MFSIITENGTEYAKYNLIKDGITIGHATLYFGEEQCDEDGEPMKSEGRPLVERIDIDEEFRSQGLGTALLKRILEDHKAVDIVPDSDDSARLYARLGEEMSNKDYNDYGNFLDDGYGVYTLR
jgi:GNAT superfamily N-acetyltransferase